MLPSGRRMFDLTATLDRDIRVEYQYDFFEDVTHANRQRLEFSGKDTLVDASEVGDFLFEFDNRWDVARAIEGLRKDSEKSIEKYKAGHLLSKNVMPMFAVENGVGAVSAIQGFVNFAGSIVNFLLIEKGHREYRSDLGVARTVLKFYVHPCDGIVCRVFKRKITIRGTQSHTSCAE